MTSPDSPASPGSPAAAAAAAASPALAASIADYEAGGYAVDDVVAAVCECGSTRFGLGIDDTEGAAIRLCLACDTEVAMLECASIADEADLVEATCTCGGTAFAVAAGFAVTGDGEVRWVSVGLECDRCGLAGVYVDWKIDYAPSRQLLSAV
ncbi:hypothetical protein [Leifsonia aquatica]|uniref:hypothetical protein n=1 Tax=Leifsonia aquatica TaxID=144185 RepID=UPI00046AC926|nr:hypothetical protein [Leifsonia aquatica]